MASLLSYIGHKSGIFLILGVLLAAALPEVSTLLLPALPFLVILILVMGLLQFDFLSAVLELSKPMQLAKTFLIVLVGTILMAICARALSSYFNLIDDYLLLITVFIAAPALSSSISLSVLMGFNSKLTLQVTILSMLLLPITGPLCFAISGIGIEADIWTMSFQICVVITISFLTALILQRSIGLTFISKHKNSVSGIAVIVMIAFLFPLFDGIQMQVLRSPWESFYILVLACVLNWGSHILTRCIFARRLDTDIAGALGFMMGNRKVSIYLAILPSDPMLSIFVAAAQLPIYLTPSLFSKKR